MYISAEICQNLKEWLELSKTGQNLTRGGMGSITNPIQDISGILSETERN